MNQLQLGALRSAEEVVADQVIYLCGVGVACTGLWPTF